MSISILILISKNKRFMRSDWVHEVWVKLSFGSVIHTDIDTQVEALPLSKSFIFTHSLITAFKCFCLCWQKRFSRKNSARVRTSEYAHEFLYYVKDAFFAVVPT